MNGNQYIWILNGICLVLTSGALAGHLLQNVALNQRAVQSSERHSGAAGRAVDGNRAPAYKHGSCSHTDSQRDPWWSVDLQDVYRISAVIITNRQSHEERLNGAEIWIGNSIKTRNNKNVRCAVISHIPKGRSVYFPCSGMEGRYVTVFLPGNQRSLCLCEVEVYPSKYVYPSPNVALKGEAAQSSTLSFAAAARAIDGRRNSFYSQGSCSHTAVNRSSPWWRVDLGRAHIVTAVKVTNRGDCCAERLDGAEIRIGNSAANNGNDNRRCASISHIRAGKTSTFQCDGGSMAGRYVSVIIPGEGKTLTLCEVEVYATPEEEPLSNVAFQRPAVQSSVLHAASRAVSGCRSSVFSDGCCSQTKLESGPWWRVELSALHKVRAVTVINRQDCCAERLERAEVRVGYSSERRGARCVTISSVQATPVHTAQCPDLKGRYVWVVLPGSERSLALCEVEVYASLMEPKAAPPPPPPPAAPLPPTLSMPLSGRVVTLVGEKLCWSDALLYCRRHHWDLLSLGSQEEQSAAEQLLGRSPFPLTHFLWLGARRYVMSATWFWMSGEPMDFTKWPRDSAPLRNRSPCGGMSGGERHLWGEQPCEELLNFVCQSRAEKGADKRVYFFSTRNVMSHG